MGFLSNKIWVRIFLGHPTFTLMKHKLLRHTHEWRHHAHYNVVLRWIPSTSIYTDSKNLREKFYPYNPIRPMSRYINQSEDPANKSEFLSTYYLIIALFQICKKTLWRSFVHETVGIKSCLLEDKQTHEAVKIDDENGRKGNSKCRLFPKVGTYIKRTTEIKREAQYLRKLTEKKNIHQVNSTIYLKFE